MAATTNLDTARLTGELHNHPGLIVVWKSILSLFSHNVTENGRPSVQDCRWRRRSRRRAMAAAAASCSPTLSKDTGYDHSNPDLKFPRAVARSTSTSSPRRWRSGASWSSTSLPASPEVIDRATW